MLQRSTSAGLASAVGTGSSTITAVSGAISGSTTLTATAATLVSISVTPANPSIAKGLTQRFTATGTFSDGSTQNLTSTVAWSSTNTGAATISASGLASTVGAGTTTITAVSGAISGSTTLTVTAATLTSISVTPANPSIAKGFTQQFTATGTFSDGSTQNLTASATWSSTNTGAATISAAGLASAVGTGTTTITAVSGAISNSTTLTVTAATLASISVTPANPSIAKGLTEQFTATGTFSDGSTQNLTTGVTWNSSNQAVATISNTSGSNGLATSVTTGSTTIQATLGAVQGATTLTVVTFNSVSVTTWQYDNSRSGQNTKETILTPSNVNSTQFGKLFSLTVDDQVFAQPLYVPGLVIPGRGTHNVLFIATESDTVYAFDADSNTGANATPLWKVSLIDTVHGESPVTSTEVGCDDLQPNIGITATPVIDTSTNTMYVETKSNDKGTYVHRLHALDITTGAEKAPGPIVIDATVNGTGDGSVQGPNGFQLTFSTMALTHHSRPGLLLLNGSVYIAFASHCDNIPYHGWLFAYNASTLAQQAVFVPTPNGGEGGFWMSGAGIAADSSGNIFLVTGNGTFDTTNTPATMWGDSILKLAMTGNSFSVLDYFTPYDQANLNLHDSDLGSGGIVLLPNQPGAAHPNLLVEVGKKGTIYVVDRDQMTTNNTHYCPTGCSNDAEIVQEFQFAIGGMWSSPSYWNNHVYFWGAGDSLKAYGLANGLLSSAPTSSNPLTGGIPSFTTAISSNGNTNGILWGILGNASTLRSTLYAFDATDLSKKFYDSTQALKNRDALGGYVKMTIPTVVNGKVYVGAKAEVDVYGLLGP